MTWPPPSWPSPPSPPRPWWKRLYITIPVGLVTLFLVIGIIGAAIGGNPKAASSSSTTATSSLQRGRATRSRTATTTEPTPTVPASTQPGSTPPTTKIASPPSAEGSGCRSGDPLANVYHPYRLQVKSACLTVTGSVAYLKNEPDGDIHMALDLPSSEANLLNQANYADQYGQLVTEIVPADEPGCTPGQPPPLPPTAYTSSSYNYGICTGADLTAPPVGTQVSVTGPYVDDADHGWMEIHPVWTISVLGQAPGGSPTTSPPATSPPTTSAPPPPTGATCTASAAPSNDGYPGDYEVYVNSNQPDTKATASDANDTWSETTNSSGYADIRLYNTSPGEPITVTVGGAICSTTA